MQIENFKKLESEKKKMSRRKEYAEIKVGKVTCRIYPIESKSNLLANVNLSVLDFVIKGFKIVEGKKGKFVSNPSQKYNNEYHDTAYCMDKELWDEVTKAIISAYEKEFE